VTTTHTWSVIDLCEAVRDTFNAVFPDELWLEGEIVGLKDHSSGHIYFDLIEPDTTGSRVDKMSVTLWRGRRPAVESVLSRAESGPLIDGIKVRIKGELTFYAPQGRVQLQMTAIDPHHTLGQLAVDKEKVLRTLSLSGLLEANGALPLPAVPLHIGLITSDGSAAYNDFVNEIVISTYPFKISLIHSSVQGADAEADLVNAVTTMSKHPVDVIAVVRGGGARTDLMAFDLESVARAVAASPVPIFSGIGHEIDRSVVDEVAHTAFKTPTACAAALVQRVAAFNQRLSDGSKKLVALAMSRHDRATALLSSAARTINDRTRRTLDVNEERLGTTRARFQRLAQIAIDRESQRIDRISDLVQALHPDRVLTRGFSITRNKNGEIVRGPVPPGSAISSETASSLILSTVTESHLRQIEETND
jgi:exodeoxyribonuclease VII large subunit